MEDWKERLVEEYKQLTKRVERLRIAVITIEESDEDYDSYQLRLMKSQGEAMRKYLEALLHRLVCHGIDLKALIAEG